MKMKMKETKVGGTMIKKVVSRLGKKTETAGTKFDEVCAALLEVLDEAEGREIERLTEKYMEWKKGDAPTYKRLKSIPAMRKVLETLDEICDETTWQEGLRT